MFEFGIGTFLWQLGHNHLYFFFWLCWLCLGVVFLDLVLDHLFPPCHILERVVFQVLVTHVAPRFARVEMDGDGVFGTRALVVV
jgi:hypothetical protein